MSSDEDDLPLPKKQRIYYGSLEEQERQRLEREGKEKLAAEELLRAQGSESSESESSDEEDNAGKKKKRKKRKGKWFSLCIYCSMFMKWKKILFACNMG